MWDTFAVIGIVFSICWGSYFIYTLIGEIRKEWWTDVEPVETGICMVCEEETTHGATFCSRACEIRYERSEQEALHEHDRISDEMCAAHFGDD